MDKPLSEFVSLELIRWIVIYLVDSAIQRLNDWGQNFCGLKRTPTSFLLLFLMVSTVVFSFFKIDIVRTSAK